MNKYIFIGGAYGDDYWWQTKLEDEQTEFWKCGELIILKLDVLNGDMLEYVGKDSQGVDEWKPIRENKLT